MSNNHINKSFEELNKPLININKSFSTMQRRFERLNKVNDELVKFNDAFSAFLYGVIVNNTAIEWTQAPTKESLREFKERHKETTLEALGPVKEFKSPVISTKHIENTKKRKDPPTAEPIPTKKSVVPNVNINSIIDRLPLMYREETKNLQNMKELLKTLRLHPNGVSMKELVASVELPQHKITTCINALIHSKHVIKHTEKGEYSTFVLNP